MRLAPMNMLTGVPLDFSASENYDNQTGAPADFTQASLGSVLTACAVDRPVLTANVPNWGMAELMWVRYTGSAALAPGRLVVLDKDFTIADLPVTANTGRPVFVTLTNFTAGNVTPQAGWVLCSGICPVQYSVAATVGAVFGGTAGTATPTAAAGRQILNATCLIAAAGSFTRTGRVLSGSPFVEVASSVGNFIGQAVSGTGIPASTTISAISPDGTVLRLNNNATASGSPTLTFTHTNFGIVQMDRAFVQGQIT